MSWTLVGRMLLVAGACALTIDDLRAHTLQLVDGRTIQGTYFGGDTRQLLFLEEDGQARHYAVTEVRSIAFEDPGPAAPGHSQALALTSALIFPAGVVLAARLMQAITRGPQAKLAPEPSP